MKRRRFSFLGAAFVALLLLFIAFLVRLMLHRPPAVVLPEPDSAESGNGAISDAGREAIRRVEVTPETVQRVIERLERPDRYGRTITIERFWSDGSGTSTASVRVAGGWTRVDVSEESGEPRHVITGAGKSWIWYGSGSRVFSGAAVLSADEEQSIPTYEDILLLPVEKIASADYRALGETECIYVETAPDEYGYVERYWVSVGDGLLAAAERLSGEAVVYRMTGIGSDDQLELEQAFRLPDGEVLYREENEETEESGD